MLMNTTRFIRNNAEERLVAYLETLGGKVELEQNGPGYAAYRLIMPSVFSEDHTEYFAAGAIAFYTRDEGRVLGQLNLGAALAWRAGEIVNRVCERIED